VTLVKIIYTLGCGRVVVVGVGVGVGLYVGSGTGVAFGNRIETGSQNLVHRVEENTNNILLICCGNIRACPRMHTDAY